MSFIGNICCPSQMNYYPAHRNWYQFISQWYLLRCTTYGNYDQHDRQSSCIFLLSRINLLFGGFRAVCAYGVYGSEVNWWRKNSFVYCLMGSCRDNMKLCMCVYVWQKGKIIQSLKQHGSNSSKCRGWPRIIWPCTCVCHQSGEISSWGNP